MSNWKTNLDLKDVWTAHDEERMTTSEVAAAVSERLAEQFPEDDEIEAIVEQFQAVEDVEEFNNAMSDLYDWADEARCWIGTRF